MKSFEEVLHDLFFFQHPNTSQVVEPPAKTIDRRNDYDCPHCQKDMPEIDQRDDGGYPEYQIG